MAQTLTTDAAMWSTLASVFGYSTFRPLQEDIVRAVLRREDVFVLMPTGGGKSLCYQLPALLQDGTTVVVSPLIALMKDQVDAMRALGVAATYINSSLDLEEVKRRQTALAEGRLKLVYVAPERLMLPGFLRLLASIPLAGIAIDEAHCISEWGHDFRPEYRELARLRELFPRVPIGAYTATATVRVQADIKAQLELKRATTFQGGFNRPNLFYEVRPKKDVYEQVVTYLRAHPQGSGIIYCASRAATDSLAEALRASGFAALAYHAGLAPNERRRRQESFSRDNTRIIVATIAFGMGIDKPDVRFVIHYDLPKSMEGYYQESGRAGRDGEPSDCILFFSGGDVLKQRHFIAEKTSAEERRIAGWQLQQMAGWAESTSCRRRALLKYFDEDFPGQDGPCCDACRTPATFQDLTVPTQMLLACVKRTGERFGATHVIQVLRGSREQRVLSLGHDRLSTYGIGKDRSDDDWRALTRELVRQGYLNQDPDAFNVLTVTEQGREVLFNGRKVELALAPRPSKKSSAGRSRSAGDPDQPHPELFERLRVLRKQMADEMRLPPYMVFPDHVLNRMAASLPATRTDLLRISGVGERKAADFGDPFLEVIAAFRRETGAEPALMPEAPPATRRSSTGVNHTVAVTAGLFRDGEGIEAIAEIRGISPRTVESHLATALEAGQELNLDRLVSPTRRAAINAAMDTVGSEYLAPVLEHLGGGYEYAELRFVRATRT